MRSTYLIRHADPFWNIPIFGYGWVLMFVALIGLVVVGYRVYRLGWNRAALADLPLLLVLAAAEPGSRPGWSSRARPVRRWVSRFGSTESWCCWGSRRGSACPYTRRGAWACIRKSSCQSVSGSLSAASSGLEPSTCCNITTSSCSRT